MRKLHILPILLILKFGLFVGAEMPAAVASESKASEAKAYKFETLIQRSDVIWGFDFLPDRRVLLTERSGEVLLYDPSAKDEKQKVKSIKGGPQVVARGQGGLLDVRVHPAHSTNKLVYFTYSKAVDGLITTALARARLEGDRFAGLQDLFVANGPSRSAAHFGSRIEFDGQGHVFIQIGDRMERERVQDLNFHTGKTIRLKEDGSVPADNPFVGRKDAKPEIWSYGHRSPQGLARHPATGELWSAEMGPRGGDEVNVIRPGLNYGWPIFTYGREYYGVRIGAEEPPKGVELPVVHWVPSISPSGIAFYTGEVFPEWKGNLFLANLSGQHVRRLELEGGKVTRQEELLADRRIRFRNVRQGPDGFLYLSTDDGRLTRLRR
jgi:aldose sugar dehydrogenase